MFGLVVLIGGWCIATAFIWNRTAVGRLNAIAVGVACFAIAFAARRHPAARWLHVALALWLFASVWLVPYDRHFAIWNNVALGIGLLLIPFASKAFADSPSPSLRA